MFLEGEVSVKRVSDGGKKPMSLLKHIYVERGTNEDWKTLQELHYKSSNLGIGPRYMRCMLEDGENPPEVIGVMVFTVPKPLDSGRNQVFKHLRPNAGGRDTRIVNVSRMKWLNNNLILSSRTVLDTMYRGAGIAYRFKNIGYRMMGLRYIESRSSMSRYNPFSIKAGMKFVKPKSAPAFETGLAFFGKWFKNPAYDLVAVKEEIATMPEALRQKTLQAVKDFYYKNSSMEKSGDNRLNGTPRIDGMELGYLLKQVQQLVFGATVYAVWANPDGDLVQRGTSQIWVPRKLPEKIPLSAFDEQGPNEPLKMMEQK